MFITAKPEESAKEIRRQSRFDSTLPLKAEGPMWRKVILQELTDGVLTMVHYFGGRRFGSENKKEGIMQ
jgi:hypothetical protein